MKGWFETLGYDFEPYQIWGNAHFEWIVNIPARRGYDRILVRGIDGEAGIRDVTALRESVDTQRTDEGWLVTQRRIWQNSEIMAKQWNYGISTGVNVSINYMDILVGYAQSPLAQMVKH